MTNDDTTLRVNRETRNELFAFKASHDDTYDDVIRRLMDESEHLKPGASSAEASS